MPLLDNRDRSSTNPNDDAGSKEPHAVGEVREVDHTVVKELHVV